MKYILAILLVLIPALAFGAGWSVTVTWTRSVGPNLANEQVFYNNASKCTVLPAAPSTCNFVIPDLSGSLFVRSINVQGAYMDTTAMSIMPAPAAATGVIVTITYVP
jgi:hypothetical protein